MGRATKCQSADYREREAQAMAAKCQSADYRERGVQAMATKCPSFEFREKKHKKRSNAVSVRMISTHSGCTIYIVVVYRCPQQPSAAYS